MGQEMKQLSLFEVAPEIFPQRKTFTPTAEHKPGDYLEDFGETNGAVICHIMRPSYIGKLVCYDCSTQSHKWTRVGILEKYFECRGVMRSVINVGSKDRILFDHYPGREIYEVGHRVWKDRKWVWK